MVKKVNAEIVTADLAGVPPGMAGPSPLPSSALIPMPHVAVTLARDPEKILEEATRAANALMRVIAAKPENKKVMMNGQQYLVFEDWQTVGRFFNLVPKTREDKLIQIQMGADIITGYEATADVIDVVTGAVISSATGMCLNDEEKWSSRTKYVWAYCTADGGHSVEDPGSNNMVWIPNPNKPGKSMPKKERIIAGEVSVPLFQLRSMAQTRACAKACRNALAWVVVMAGFAPTPAEELDNLIPDTPEPQHEQPSVNPQTSNALADKVAATAERVKPPTVPPKKKAATKQAASFSQAAPVAAVPTPPAPPPPAQPATTPPRAAKPLSPAQVRRFWTIARTNGWSNDAVHDLLLNEAKVDHTEDIPSPIYNRLVDDFLVYGPKKAGYGEAVKP